MPAGVIPLLDYRVVAVDDGPRPHLLAVETPKRTYYVSAKTDKEMMDWLAAIHFASRIKVRCAR
jgi:guanine nucleotide exchange factor for Rho/Rac/Cdc42-like GTPase family protein